MDSQNHVRDPISSETPHGHAWVRIGAGNLVIGHRPRLRNLARLKQGGCTHVVTILSEKEGALAIRDACATRGLAWIWLPLPTADPPGRERRKTILATFIQLRELLEGSACLFMHCSGGIHRTGMLMNAFLRFLGYSESEAASVLRTLRETTLNGLHARHLEWAKHFVPPPGAARDS